MKILRLIAVVAVALQSSSLCWASIERVIFAQYGARERFVNVTKVAQTRWLRDGRINFPSVNITPNIWMQENGSTPIGDPIFGVGKTLTLQVVLDNGQLATKAFPEGSSFGNGTWDGTPVDSTHGQGKFVNGVMQVAPLFGKYVGWSEQNRLPESGKGSVSFQVTPTNGNLSNFTDVHIGFSRTLGGDIVYELPLGGWNNTQSVVRKTPQGANLYTSSTRLSSVPANLTVTLDKSSKTITVTGLSGVFSWTDPNFDADALYFAFSSFGEHLTYSSLTVTSYLNQAERSQLQGAINTATAELKAVTDAFAAVQVIDAAAANGIWSQADIDKINPLLSGMQPHIDILKNLANSVGAGNASLVRAITNEVQDEIDTAEHTQQMLHELVEKSEDDKAIADATLATANTEKDAAAKNLADAQAIPAAAPKNICSPDDLRKLTDLMNQANGHSQKIIALPDAADHDDAELFASLTGVVKPALDAATVSYKALQDLVNQETQKTAAQLAADKSATMSFVDDVLALPRLEGSYKGWDVDHKLPVAGVGVVAFHAEGSSEIHVGFAETIGGKIVYEFVFGDSNNSRSVLRDGAQGNELYAAEGATLPSHAVDLKISLDKRTGKISVVGLSKPFEWIDPNFKAKAHYFGFSSWEVPVTVSKVDVSIDVAAPKGFDEVDTTCVNETIACGSRNGELEVWSVGDHGTVLAHYLQDSMAEKPWEEIKPKDAAGKDLVLETVSVSSDGIMVALDTNGAGYQFDWNKQAFTALVAGAGNEKLDLDVIAVGNAGNIWAVDVDTKTLYQHTTTGWVSREEGVAVDVAVGVDGTVVVLNASGRAHMMIGERQWKEMSKDHMLNVAVGSKGNIWGITDDNEVAQYVNDAWVTINDAKEKPALFYKDVAVNAAGTVFALSCDADVFNKGEAGFAVTKPAAPAVVSVIKAADGKAKKTVVTQIVEGKAVVSKKSGKQAKKITKEEKNARKAKNKVKAVDNKKAVEKKTGKPVAPKRGKKGAKAAKIKQTTVQLANSANYRTKAAKKAVKKTAGKSAAKSAGSKKTAGKVASKGAAKNIESKKAAKKSAKKAN